MGTTTTISTSLVTTTPQARLGEIFVEKHSTPDRGEREWIYVQNGEASTAFAAGNLIARKADSLTYVGILSPISCAGIRCFGFAQHAIPAGSYGWILRRGVGTIKADAGNLTEGDATSIGFIPGDTAGTVADATGVTVDVIGYAPTAILATATGTAYINCRG